MNHFKQKWLLASAVVVVILVLALLGGQWSTGQAGLTVPTIPAITSFSPHAVHVNSGTFVLTINGNGFNQLPWIGVRWFFPPSTDILLTPFYVSPDGTSLQVQVPASLITQIGQASVWVVNNPTANDPREEAGPVNINIIPYKYYCPLMNK